MDELCALGITKRLYLPFLSDRSTTEESVTACFFALASLLRFPLIQVFGASGHN